MLFLDSLLNRITMYRLVLYGLVVIAAVAIVESILGILPFGTVQLAMSLCVILAACAAAQYAGATILRAAASVESVWITALILFLTLAPLANPAEAGVLALAGVLAIGSKFIFAIRARHLFNPAATALFILSITGSGMATWWVGTPVLLPAVLIVGTLVVRKIRRFDAVAAFGVSAAGITLLFSLVRQLPATGSLIAAIASGPIVFFATIMLIEPRTLPQSRPLRIIFGVIVGLLFASQFHLGSLYATPQFALVIGNIYAYIVSSKAQLILVLERIERLSAHAYEFVFKPNQALEFVPGQYMEWTLPHAHADSRGNRRYFTIASAPEENVFRLSTSMPENPSSFKHALGSLQDGGIIAASVLSGDFVLPGDASRKLAFIAGGVGITPYASMLRHLLRTGQRRDIVLIYAVSSDADIAYRTLIEESAQKVGIRILYRVGEHITREYIAEHIPDHAERHFYVSGPQAMVSATRAMLHGLQTPHSRIKTDYFPGL